MQPFPFLYNPSVLWERYFKPIETCPKEAQPLILRETIAALQIISDFQNVSLEEFDSAVSLLGEYVGSNEFLSLFTSYLRRAITAPDIFFLNVRQFSAKPARVIAQRQEQRQFFEFVEKCYQGLLCILKDHEHTNIPLVVWECFRFLRLPIAFLKPDPYDETVIVACCDTNGNLILEKALYPDYFPVVLQYIFSLNDPDKTPVAALVNEFYAKNGIRLSDEIDFARLWYQIENHNEICRKQAISPTPSQT